MNRREAIIAGMAGITAAVAVTPRADAQASEGSNPDLVRCGNCGGSIWGRVACISA